MTDAGVGKAPLTHDQQRYLQVVFDYFRDNSKWPKGRYLERELLKEGLDARQIALSLVGRIGDPPYTPSWDPNREVRLSVPDLMLCQGSDTLLNAFIASLQLCVARYMNDDKPRISNLDLIVQLHMQDTLTRQVGLIFESEPNLFTSMGTTTMGWEMGISDQMFDFRNVRTLEDYLALRWKPPQVPASPIGLSEPGLSIQQPAGADVNASAPPSRDVFIVHGHDEAAREATARFIEQLGLRPIILHEQANQGLTIIEKFEKHAQVAFAVVLLTPDDVGAPVTTPDATTPRARQNVILELGYFLGRLRRDHVCALYKRGVELPSDMSGVLYVPMDDEGAWKQTLARELNAAGLDIHPVS